MSRHLRFEDETVPAANPAARAYFRAINPPAAQEANRARGHLPAESDEPPDLDNAAEALASVVDILLEEGVLTQQPRALLNGSQGRAPRRRHIEARMQFVLETDQAVYSTRNQELAYLANTLMAGCSIQGRRFTGQEASDASVAICSLGLENWPSRWLPAEARRKTPVTEARTALPDDFLVGHDLISVFQVGWTVLHADVSMYAAEQLIGVLTDLQCEDHKIQTDLDALRIEMVKHWQAGVPWRAQGALEVIAMLDLPAWATLLGLINECPVIHAGLGALRGSGKRAVSASSFEFISENSQITSVREFMQALSEELRP
jgi:hypothetical protein